MRRHHHHHLRQGRHVGEDPTGEERSHGGHRGRRRRLFDSGELRLVLLSLIQSQPRHGYDLIREIEALSGGGYAPSPGVVYPTLTLLLDMGFIEETGAEGARKLFAITPAGVGHLAEHVAQTDEAMSRLQALARIRERTDAAPVVRAMRNLKAAVHDRLSQDGVDRDVILDVAGLIDQAASQIERL